MMEMMGEMFGWFMALGLIYMILVVGAYFIPAVIGFARVTRVNGRFLLSIFCSAGP